MTNFKFKRCGAYLIDLLIISLLVSLISQINFLTPNQAKYTSVVNEYNEYMESNFGNVTSIETDELITEEYADYMYKINYYALSYSLIEIVVIILYFTLFPLFNNNQTIGKRLFKIKVETLNGDNVSTWKHFVRAILTPICANVIFYNIITLVLNVSSLFIFKGLTYLYINVVINYIITIFCYIDVIMALVRKDRRSLRDVICKTRVVERC